MMSAAEHKKIISEIFIDSFKDKSMPIALYGIGINTEEILKLAHDYNIVGLMDAKKEGEFIYGYPVLTAQEVIEKAKCIVIVAREEVLPIIYNRISFLEEKGIEIYNIRHKKIMEKVSEDYKNNPYWNKTKDSLIEEINKHDIITVDVFDTLLLRRVQRPTDIFEIVEKKLENTEYKCSFYQMRCEAEALANKVENYPTYELIYKCMQEHFKLSDEKTQYLKKLEFETEQLFLNVRKPIAEMLSYAKKAGKKVFLLSDMYFTKAEIAELIKPFSITEVDDIFVSSDLKKAKWPNGDAYSFLKDKFGHEYSYLHIGDSLGADIEKAKENGIDPFYVMSVYDMMVHSSVSKLLVNVKTLYDSVAIGMLCDYLFNDPFILADGRGKVKINDSYSYGYLGFAILVMGAVDWIVKKAENEINSRIWFLARDGYVFEKVYKIYEKYAERKLPLADYVMSSRIWNFKTIMKNKDDIKEAIIYLPKNWGNKKILEDRFGVKNIGDIENKAIEELLVEYEAEIIKNSAEYRSRYLNYLKPYCNNADKIIAFDLVTSGTIVYFLNKILDKEIYLYCLETNCVPCYSVVDEMNFSVYLGEDMGYISNCKVSERKFLLESILTSESPMLNEIDEKGNFIFANKEKSQNNLEELKAAHKGITVFAEEFCKLTKNIFCSGITSALVDDCFGVFTDNNYVDLKMVAQNFEAVDFFQGFELN